MTAPSPSYHEGDSDDAGIGFSMPMGSLVASAGLGVLFATRAESIFPHADLVRNAMCSRSASRAHRPVVHAMLVGRRPAPRAGVLRHGLAVLAVRAALDTRLPHPAARCSRFLRKFVDHQPPHARPELAPLLAARFLAAGYSCVANIGCPRGGALRNFAARAVFTFEIMFRDFLRFYL